MKSPLEAALGRHRLWSVVALLILTVLAWIWLYAGAGMSVHPLVSLSPPSVGETSMPGSSMDMAMAPEMPWTADRFILTFSMWLVMMVATMLPSAAPMILLYARAAAQGQSLYRPATESFLAGYLGAWAAFSMLATGLQFLLERIGLLDPELMASQSRWLSSAVLAAAGIYQLTPLKGMCLRQCRNPAQFLSRHYQPGWLGALRLGLLHGAFCVGCCWLLMALLFVGGVMNLAWIALVTLMVAAEKYLPHGRIFTLATGIGCLVWGAVILFG